MADKIKGFADTFASYFQDIAGIITGLIGNAAEKQAQEFNKKIESIERERNAVLTGKLDKIFPMFYIHDQFMSWPQRAYAFLTPRA